MKKRMLFPILMAGITMSQALLPVMAAEVSDPVTYSETVVTGEGEQVETAQVIYDDALAEVQCTVSIPKVINLAKDTKSQEYQITAKGNLNVETTLKVEPVDAIEETADVIDFNMVRQDRTGVADVKATVTQADTEWSNDEVTETGTSKSGTVAAPDITPGEWQGNLSFAIGLYDTVTGDLITAPTKDVTP